MYLHITFENGSNPYIKYGNEDEIQKEAKRWDRNYRTETVKQDASGIQLYAKERTERL